MANLRHGLDQNPDRWRAVCCASALGIVIMRRSSVADAGAISINSGGFMKKLLAVLFASMFAATTVYAAAHMKAAEDKKGDAKKEAKKDDAKKEAKKDEKKSDKK